ncbi:DUF6227 family protein [Streptomyces sp. ODS28]|uniref:DUF6227 family protein n=1 Tax=Streptomyces sp. ODS28 TaxID=3136688 RepID=UPI0031EA4838
MRDGREGTELSPVQALHSLLARSRNPFDVSDATLERLELSVLHEAAPDHGRHVPLPGDPPRPWWGCFRHVFLLRDGTSELLWELCYDAGPGALADDGAPGGLQSEVYEREHELRRAERRVPGRGDGAAGGSAGAGGGPGAQPFGLVPQAARLPRQRGYSERGSADHARRLLRRAENADRPGEDVLRRLSTAQAHEIMHVPRPHALVHEWHVWCSVYEHAFLLADGSELSLYELEHDLTGTGRLVCEVYLEEAMADKAVHRHAKDNGFEV